MLVVWCVVDQPGGPGGEVFTDDPKTNYRCRCRTGREGWGSRTARGSREVKGIGATIIAVPA